MKARLVVAALLTWVGPALARADTMSGHVAYGAPDGLSAGLSFVLGQDDHFFDSKWGSHGTVVQFSAGTSGARASLGKGGVSLATIGYSIKGTALWTWGTPQIGPPGAVYVGAEIQGSCLGRVSLGILKSVSGPPSTPALILTGTIGLGF